MKTKKILYAFLFCLIVFSVIYISSYSNKTSYTTINIRNNTNEVITNLIFSSNSNEKNYNISKLEPHTDISFEYDLGGFNENSVNLKHIHELENSKNPVKTTYNIIGYVSKSYSNIDITILSIDSNGKLNIRVNSDSE